MIQKFKDWLHLRRWQYGKCRGQIARCNRRTGEVQFILWPKGSNQAGHIHTEDFWIAFNSFWWPEFTPS